MTFSSANEIVDSIVLEEPAELPPFFERTVAQTSHWLHTPDSPVTQSMELPQSLVVMKFGGTSLASASHLLRCANIVRQALPQRPVVVASAMGKTTNALLHASTLALETGEVDISAIRTIHETALKELGVEMPASISELLNELEKVLSGVALLKEISMQTRDRIVSFGERLSVRTFAEAFNSSRKDPQEPEARALDAWQVGMKTTSGSGSADSAFSSVEILQESYPAIKHHLGPLKLAYSFVPIVTGYIAKDARGVITTLGRDGSDLTATVIGAAVKASEVQIWKDVSGVQTTDPRVIAAAKPVQVLTFEEAAELSTFGSKVVHPAAVLPAWSAGVPMSVKNSMAPELPGTRIVPELGGKDVREGRVAAISSKKNITMIVIKSSRMLGQHGFLAHVFQVFNKFAASVDVIATSEVTVSLTLDEGYKTVDLSAIEDELKEVAKVSVLHDMSMLTLITHKEDSVSVLKESCAAFEPVLSKLEMVSHGASNVNVTFVAELRAAILELLRATKFPFVHAAYVLGLNGSHYSLDTATDRHYGIPLRLPRLLCQLFRLEVPNTDFTTIRIQKFASSVNFNGTHRTLPVNLHTPFFPEAEDGASSPEPHVEENQCSSGVPASALCSRPKSHPLSDAHICGLSPRWPWRALREPGRRRGPSLAPLRAAGCWVERATLDPVPDGHMASMVLANFR
ncbi:AK1 [Symbiodinium necroappetens]|uniref:aspartate kinase n=1 Tax=Symbiodinium necroappetens TaxID=1628268 RepID=A0A813CBZ2_9DINO|nr:AK1 [Symbiodinium necroappetens]